MSSGSSVFEEALDIVRKNALQTGVLIATAIFAARLINNSRDKRLEHSPIPEPGAREKGKLLTHIGYNSEKTSYLALPMEANLQTVLAASDPGLLAKYSDYKAVQTSIARYPAIRTFYKPHSQADKLPNHPPLPLLVFLHGLGGSLAQLNLLLTSLVNVGPCLGIDLPGCGLSRFSPSRWEAYSFKALVEIWIKAIEGHCKSADGQQVVLIGHSMGCLIAQAIASRSRSGQLAFEVAGVVAICPGANKFEPLQKTFIGTLLSIPTPVFDLWRAWDKRGGIDSGSVSRFVGGAADRATRELQLKFNDQSQTPVFRRMAWGLINGSTPLPEDWARLAESVRILLIGAEDDPVTPIKQLQNIRAAIEASKPSKIVKTAVVPGSHALPFDHNNYRSVAGLIEAFLGDLDERLALGWQLKYLATEGKWDVKNFEKWKEVQPVSEPVGRPGSLFRAMKTMREIDAVHSPKQFAKDWKGKVVAVIDISHDAPVYDPKSLQEGGIDYYKFPTVSKYPPDENEVRDFIQLVDRIRAEVGEDSSHGQVVVHCHYGFNRTGFFIAAYLIEKEAYSVQEAVAEFAEKRPPGIRHQHFLDTIYMRYSDKARSAS